MKKGLFARLDNELAARKKAAGLSMANLLQLPHDERTIMLWLVRRGEASLSDIAAQLDQETEVIQNLLNSLVAQYFVRELTVSGERRYRARLTSGRRPDLPLNVWQDLLHKIESEGDAPT